MNIPFLSFEKVSDQIKEESLKVFESFFDSNYYVLGTMVRDFEAKYSKFNQTNFTIGVANGLDALHLSLRALGIKNGDEVIVPSNTYIATVLAISYTGATPIFVEPRKSTYNLDPELLENAINSRTKCIMPVHLYGQACEMDEIMRIANKHNLFVVEDNAQAHGASFNGELTGSFGDVNATSFYPSKNLGALGDGGAVTTNSQLIADKIKTLRNYGSQKRYYNETVGYNSRLDELQAGILNLKLNYLSEWTSERQDIGSFYNQKLRGVGDLILPHTVEGASNSYHLYVVRTKFRDELQEYLTKNNVGSLIHYPIPPHLQEAYTDLGYRKGDFPIAEEIANTILSLPLFIGMKEEELESVVQKVKDFYSHKSV